MFNLMVLVEKLIYFHWPFFNPQLPSSFSRKSVSVPASTATSRYSTPSAPWREQKYVSETLQEGVLVPNDSWTHLAGADQFVVFELSQLGPQGEVRVHQERLPTTLVEVLEWQSCAQSVISTLPYFSKASVHFKMNSCLPVYEGLSLFSSWNFTNSLKIPLQKGRMETSLVGNKCWSLWSTSDVHEHGCH